MRKPIAAIVLAAAIAATLGLAGCSSPASTSSSGSGSGPETTKSSPTPKSSPKPPVLTGTWKSETSDPKSYQEATIGGNVISINWVTEGGDTKSIYWVGSFTAPTTASAPFTWTSARDKAATDNALLASTDDTKTFSYSAGVISYTASALGTTTTVKLHKE